MAQPFPQSPGGTVEQPDSLTSLTFTSTLRPTLLNEVRIGALRSRYRFYAPWEVAGTDLQPKTGSQSYLIDFGQITDPLNLGNDPQGRLSPSYQFFDKVSWLRGKHSLKLGGEARYVSTNGFNSFDVTPRAVLGTGSQPLQNIGAISGIGANQGAAEAILNELSGSLVRVVQALNSAGGASPSYLPGEGKQRTWRQREFMMFFQDDFKVTPELTLNIGLRYEWFGVPWEANGKAAGVVGGSAGLFGLSGTSFGDLYQPGHLAGSPTRVELVGRNSPNPGRKLYDNDWNNFAPSIGLGWSLPWFGKNKTVLRVGYGWSYERNSLRILDVVAGDQPGLREAVTFTSASFLSLANFRLPLTPAGRPLDEVPLTDRTQSVRAFDSRLRSPYAQSYNASLQRALPGKFSLDVRYVGNKGTKLIRGTNLNEAMIYENGILDAFRLAQTGGQSPLLDRVFPGTTRGADFVRANTTTQTQLAGNNVGAFAAYLNNTDIQTGQRGGLLRRANLPENWVLGNPQFAASNLTGNFANSTYHALQVELTRRFSSGWLMQANYSWSRAIGEEEGSGQEQLDSYRDARNRGLDKRLLTFHRTHAIRGNAIWELPFGPGKRFGGASRGLLARLVERWQVGPILQINSGQPISLTSAVTSYNQFTDNSPVPVTVIPKSLGNVTRTGQGVIYFTGFGQAPDPSIASMTTLNNIRGRSTLKAITDASGNILLVNPTPGALGSLGPTFLEGPAFFRLDVAALKRIQITESKNLELRADIEKLHQLAAVRQSQSGRQLDELRPHHRRRRHPDRGGGAAVQLLGLHAEPGCKFAAR